MSELARLPDELTIHHAAATRERWLLALASGTPTQPLRVDASDVAEVDAAGLQLLLSLQQSAAHQGGTLELVAASAALRAACAVAGLESLLVAGAAA